MAGEPFTVRHAAALADIPREAWDALFPERAENWDYLRACEAAAPEGFAASAIAAYAGGKLMAAAPLFATDYRLDMSLKGVLQPVADWLYRHTPKLVVAPVLGIGSPLTEECPLGFAPGIVAAERLAAFAALLQGLEAHAAAHDVPILALKDVTDRDAAWATGPLEQAGFCRVATLPVATLHLPYPSESAYLAELSGSMRADIVRKMKRAGEVTIEVRDRIDDVEAEIVALFEETRAQRKADYGAFDNVPARYFGEVMRSGGGRAQVMLTRVGGRLMSFNIALLERERVLAKYIGMRYPQAREHNIYFVNWMAMVRLCIERGIPWLQTGQTAYRQKVRLGAKLKRSWVFFKHRNPLINPLFKLFGPGMAFDKMDPDLQALGDSAPYLEPGAAP